MKINHFIAMRKAQRKMTKDKKSKSWALASLSAGTPTNGPEIVLYDDAGAIIGILHFENQFINEDKMLRILAEIEARL